MQLDVLLHTVEVLNEQDQCKVLISHAVKPVLCKSVVVGGAKVVVGGAKVVVGGAKMELLTNEWLPDYPQ